MPWTEWWPVRRGWPSWPPTTLTVWTLPSSDQAGSTSSNWLASALLIKLRNFSAISIKTPPNNRKWFLKLLILHFQFFVFTYKYYLNSYLCKKENFESFQPRRQNNLPKMCSVVKKMTKYLLLKSSHISSYTRMIYKPQYRMVKIYFRKIILDPASYKKEISK